MKLKNKKVLVVKLCCIGDIIQLTPALRALKEGGCEVHLLCAKWAAEIAAMVPFIDRIHIADMKAPFSIAKAIWRLRTEKFGLVINFHRDLKSYIFISCLGAVRRAGFDWKNGGFFLDERFKYNPAIHETERYLSITDGLGFNSKDKYTSLKPPAAAAMQFSIKENVLKVGIFPAGGNNPGTVMPTKRWPVYRFNELIKKFEARGAVVYVFGAEFDRPIISAAIEGTNASPVITGLKDFAFYAAKMDIFIGCDTGPMHIASALGVKTIGLYGPSSPEIFGARGINSVNLWMKQACAPCYEPSTVLKREFLRCADNICMKAITTEMVLEAADKLLIKKI
jgi:heptosyltransferase-2/heptosyltransferase-3